MRLANGYDYYEVQVGDLVATGADTEYRVLRVLGRGLYDVTDLRVIGREVTIRLADITMYRKPRSLTCYEPVCTHTGMRLVCDLSRPCCLRTLDRRAPLFG